MVSQQAAGLEARSFDQKMSEGAALSKKSMRISYSVTHSKIRPLRPTFPIVVATVDLSGGTARLTNKRLVYESNSKACTIEAQDFFDNDKKMTFTCYEPQHLASAMTIDLDSGKVENMSKAPGTYNECEGIYPDGRIHQCGRRPPGCQLAEPRSRNIDIWKLRLDGTGRTLSAYSLQRL